MNPKTYISSVLKKSSKFWLRCFICLFFISLTIHISHSQWVQQTSGVTSPLYDAHFINQNTGWVCGDNGTIIKTTNGGLNWITQNSGVTNKPLFGIHAVDSQYAYCVGWWQTILKTTNGGNNWIIIRNGPNIAGNGSFFKCFFLNANTGWLLRNNYILRTLNGGQTFDSTQMIYSYTWDIFFKDALTGVLCGDGALIMKSTDGGINWNVITIPLAFEAPNFYRESFIDSIGWIVGAGSNNPAFGPLVWKTTNFGTSWDTISRVSYPYTHENYSVFFSSINTGWCGGTYGHIYKTTNSGFNWQEQNVPIDGFRGDFWFFNDSIGWAIGGGGRILKTTDGGSINPPGTVLFCDNFENGLSNWVIDTIRGCTWSIQSINPLRYSFPFGAYGHCLSADESLCYPSPLISTATTISIDCSGKQQVYGEFDNDWYPNYTRYDSAKVQASYDGGSTWEDIIIFTNTNRMSHPIFQLPKAANIPKLKVRLYSILHDSSFFLWAVDNFCIKGYDYIGISNNQNNIPQNYSLCQNYPNPFNPSTEIKYALPYNSFVSIKIYNLIGEEIAVLVNNEFKDAGFYEVTFDGINYASGVYFYRIEAGKFVQSKKMVLVK
jgi:photosystem II stability/assembly factor-like uncharacterized protein